MLISQLILELQRIRASHGDLEVEKAMPLSSRPFPIGRLRVVQDEPEDPGRALMRQLVAPTMAPPARRSPDYRVLL